MHSCAVAEVRDSLGPALDWFYLLDQAQHHAVLPLVARNVQLHFQDLAPEEASRFLTEAAWEGMRRNMVLTAELLRIESLFEKAGIQGIPFKGPALAMQAYGDLALRMYADLDILVREQDLDGAVSALLSDGYKLEYALTPKQERIYRKRECALQLRHAARKSVVELHWLLTERYLSIDLQIGELWDRCRRMRIGPKPMLTLSPEDLFLYICVHGSKHRWERLEWLCSVAAVATANPEMQWEAVRRRARSSGTERMLNVSLLLVRDLLGMPVPEAVRDTVERDSAAAHLAEEMSATIFCMERRDSQQQMNRGDWYLYLLRMRERWQDKLRILVYSSLRLPHPSSREIIRLPSKLDFLYYILRPARLVGATVWAAMRHAGTKRRRARNTRQQPVAETPVATFLSR